MQDSSTTAYASSEKQRQRRYILTPNPITLSSFPSRRRVSFKQIDFPLLLYLDYLKAESASHLIT